MKNLITDKSYVIYKRNEDVIRLTPCAENAIRFEAFPGGEIFEESFTLMPQVAECEISEKDNCVFMSVGSLKAQLEENGKITFSKNGKRQRVKS